MTGRSCGDAMLLGSRLSRALLGGGYGVGAVHGGVAEPRCAFVALLTVGDAANSRVWFGHVLRLGFHYRLIASFGLVDIFWNVLWFISALYIVCPNSWSPVSMFKQCFLFL